MDGVTRGCDLLLSTDGRALIPLTIVPEEGRKQETNTSVLDDRLDHNHCGNSRG